MRSSTKDKIQGTLREAKGKVKEESGKVLGNPNLRDRGTGEKVGGKVQKKIGDAKKVLANRSGGLDLPRSFAPHSDDGG